MNWHAKEKVTEEMVEICRNLRLAYREIVKTQLSRLSQVLHSSGVSWSPSKVSKSVLPMM